MPPSFTIPPLFLDDPIKASFIGKKILAPMVRIGALPMRLLAKNYGAGTLAYLNYVYGPEIVDKRIIGSERIVNETLGTIDYVKKGTLNFRCLPKEKPYLIFQLGTADPELAVKAAQTIAQDVAMIDVNCGCPKPFSIQGGMGAALLSSPDLLCNILTSLVQNLHLPITAKIRLLPEKEATLNLIDKIINTGISALAVHCRTKQERPKDPGHWDMWECIANQFGHRIPIIANGDIFTTEDITKAFKIPNISSVMIARAAQWNPSIFAHPNPVLPQTQVIQDFLTLAFQYDHFFPNTKYILLQLLVPTQDHDIMKKVQSAKHNKELAELFSITDILHYHQEQTKLREQELGIQHIHYSVDE